MKDAGNRAALRQQVLRFLEAFPSYRGLSLDFESLSDDASPAYMAFIHELYADLHSRNLRLFVTVASSTNDKTLKEIADNSD